MACNVRVNCASYFLGSNSNSGWNIRRGRRCAHSYFISQPKVRRKWKKYRFLLGNRHIHCTNQLRIFQYFRVWHRCQTAIGIGCRHHRNEIWHTPVRTHTHALNYDFFLLLVFASSYVADDIIASPPFQTLDPTNNLCEWNFPFLPEQTEFRISGNRGKRCQKRWALLGLVWPGLVGLT